MDKEHNEESRYSGRIESGRQLARLILEMIGLLHDRGYESLYIDPVMSPSGCYWRYEIGAMVDGQWPNKNLSLRKEFPPPINGSVCGKPKESTVWAKNTDTLTTFTDGFVRSYAELLNSARKPKPAYVKWYKQMLDKTAPDGNFIFWCDLGPNHQHAFSWSHQDFKMPMPPGYVAIERKRKFISRDKKGI